MKLVVAAICGVLFGAGLSVAGMTNPAKVLAFLDVFGNWDPTLAIVMGAALATYAAGFQVSKRMRRAWLGEGFGVPALRDLDPQLIGGATLFGVGWGLVGLCPGPALASLGTGPFEAAVFVGWMVAGVIAFRFVAVRRGMPHASASKP